MDKKIVNYAVLNAFATALYIAVIASLLFYAPKIFGSDEPDTVLIPIGMLCLFVFSAALTSFLMFGRPVLWYLDGKRQEALSLLAWTLGTFFVITIIVFLALLLIGRT